MKRDVATARRELREMVEEIITNAGASEETPELFTFIIDGKAVAVQVSYVDLARTAESDAQALAAA